jgi:hypothetical protein
MTTNKTIWKKTIYKTGVWLAVEIWLNVIGLDKIANYSEFIFAQDLNLSRKNRQTVKITEYPSQFCPQINDFCPIPETVTKPKDLEANSDIANDKIFKNKCQQLSKPCIKVVCLAENT